MGIFVKDNISGINIGSKSSDVSGKTVQSSNIDISNIERGNSDFTSESNISSSVDFGDLFDDKASGSEVTSSSMSNGKTNVDGTNQSSQSVSQQGMTNDKVNQENSNQQTGNAQSASLSNGKNNENNSGQTGGTANAQGTTSSENQGGSTGQTGGSANGASTSSGKGPSGSTGGSTGKASGNSMSGGNSSGGQGSHGGSKAGGVEVKSTTVQNATRPTALNNNSSMKNTGTTVSQRTVNASHVETNASKAESNTGGILGKAVRWFVKEVIHVIEVVESTKVVIATSVLSAVGNIVEAVVIDGLVGYVVAGVLDLCGADDVANDLRKFAARDQVGEINKWFYEETDIGKRINELSAIKYDSAIAKGITTFTETAVKIAAATAIAALPGGIFILAGIGALEGMGNAAESAYQNALANGETDLTLSVLSNLGILGSGALDAVAWIFNAKLGQGLLNIAGDIGELGIKEAGTTILKQIFSKETLSNALKPSNLLMNLGQSGLQSGGKIGPIFSKIVNGEEISVGEWGDLALTFGLYFLINTLEDSAREYVSGYEAGGNQSFGQRNVTGGEETKKPEASEPEETQFKQANSEDIGAKQPEASKVEGVEKLGEEQPKSLNDLFKEKYPDAIEGKDYKISRDSTGKEYIEWIDYQEYLKKTMDSRKLVFDNANQNQKIFINGYISEGKEYSYKTANGLMRDNIFTLDADGNITQVTLHGIYADEVYDIDKFPPIESGDFTIEEWVLHNKQGILDTDIFMRENPLDQPTVSYRGIPKAEGVEAIFGKQPWELTLEDIQKYIDSEKQFEAKGFLSTAMTESSDPVDCSKIVYVFQNAEGTPAIDMKNFGGITSEQELLVAPGTIYNFTHVEEVNGKFYIFCESDTSVDYQKAGEEFRDSVDKMFDQHLKTAKQTDELGTVQDKIDLLLHPEKAFYDDAPSCKTNTELLKYTKDTIGEADGEYKVTAAILKRINEEAANSSFASDANKYYEYSNIAVKLDGEIPPSQYSKIMMQAIEGDADLRKSIKAGAADELQMYFKDKFGLTDEQISDVLDSILGKEFVEKGIGAGSDWDHFMEIIETPMGKKIQEGIDSGKEPVIWSKFPNETHPLMDEKFVTISNTSIGDLGFIETVYSNWDDPNVSKYKATDLWAKLSTAYAGGVSDAVDPKTGDALTSLKFLYPKDVPLDQSLGELFKYYELPEIASYGTIETITMSRTDPDTMEILETIDIDITDINEFCEDYIGKFGDLDDFSKSEMIKMFTNKLLEAMK